MRRLSSISVLVVFLMGSSVLDVRSVPFSGKAWGQEDSYQALSAEADALSAIDDPSEFVETASPLLDRVTASLSGSQLSEVAGKIDAAAGSWLRQSNIEPSLTPEAAEFLVSRGISTLQASERPTIAAQWLLKPDAGSRHTATTVSLLGSAAGDALTHAQRASLVAEINGGLSPLEELSLDDLQSHHTRIENLAPPTYEAVRDQRQQVAQWLSSRDAGMFTDQQRTWLVEHSIPQKMSSALQQLEATWEGRIIAPASGQYIFSVTPLALSGQWAGVAHRHWMSVEVEGQKIVDASPENWDHQGDPVSLQSGQAANLKVTLRYECSGDEPPRPAIGQLFWSGPGMERQLVTGQFLRLPESNDPGLRLSARYVEQSGEHADQIVVENMDQVLAKYALCTYGDVLDECIERCVDYLLSAPVINDDLTKATDPDLSKRTTHVLLGGTGTWMDFLQNCSTPIRRRIASELALRPELFGPVEPRKMINRYSALRPGAEREAIDVLGTWLMVHADRVPELAGDTDSYYDMNVEPYRYASIRIASEHPEAVDWIEQGYLLTLDGRCSLPSAYLLTDARLISGRMLEWIEMLEERLDDQTLDGDERVNWLIARAVAEELRGAPSNIHHIGRPRLSAGMGWLDEAMLFAQTQEVKERVARERVARLAALQKWDAAEAALEGFPGLTDWQARLVELRSQAKIAQEKQRAAADAAFLAELRRRQSKAVARGDSDSASRYATLIDEIQEGSTP